MRMGLMSALHACSLPRTPCRGTDRRGQTVVPANWGGLNPPFGEAAAVEFGETSFIGPLRYP